MTINNKIAKGKIARKDMVNKYNPHTVAETIIQRLKQINKVLKLKERGEGANQNERLRDETQIYG